jgi:hypothetical protein
VTLAVLVLSVLAWAPYPAGQATGLEVLMWVRRPVFVSCDGGPEMCLARYDLVDAHVERVPPAQTRVEWEHPLGPGQVLYAEVIAWRGDCRSW